MRSTVTVLDPAKSINLVSLATVKAILGARDRSLDEKLNILIHWASADCNRYCGRVLMAEKISETFEQDHVERLVVEHLVLNRKPIVEIDSILEGNTLLDVTTDYLRDDRHGILTRGTVHTPRRWPARKIAVVYTGGFPQGAVDPSVERACAELVVAYHHSAARDMLIRRVEIADVGMRIYADPPTGEPSALPQTVRDALDPYRKVA